MLIQRAFIKETLRGGGAVSIILFSIFLLVRVLGFMRQASDGDIPFSGVALLVLLKMITYLDLLIPFAIYLSAALVLARMQRDNEITVINANAMSITILLKPVLQLSLLVGLLVAVCSLYLSPQATYKARQITAELRKQAELGGIIAGRFIETKNGGAYFVEDYDARTATLKNLFVYEGGSNPNLTVAEFGKQVDENGISYLILQNGVRYRITAGYGEYNVTEFNQYGVRIRPPAAITPRTKLTSTPTLDLLKATGAASYAELHWRFAKIIILPVLLIFSLSLINNLPRARTPMLVAAILIYFVYVNLLGLGTGLAAKNTLPPHATLWGLHILFLSAALYCLYRRHRGLNLFPTLK